MNSATVMVGCEGGGQERGAGWASIGPGVPATPGNPVHQPALPQARVHCTHHARLHSDGHMSDVAKLAGCQAPQAVAGRVQPVHLKAGGRSE